MATAFATTLRRMGVPVATGDVVSFVQALGSLGIDSRSASQVASRIG